MVGRVRAVSGVRRTWRLCFVICAIAAVSEPLHQASLDPHAAVLCQRKQPVFVEGNVEPLLGVVTDLLLERMLRKWNTILCLRSLYSMWVELRQKGLIFNTVPPGLVPRGHHEIYL